MKTDIKMRADIKMKTDINDINHRIITTRWMLCAVTERKQRDISESGEATPDNQRAINIILDHLNRLYEERDTATKK